MNGAGGSGADKGGSGVEGMYFWGLAVFSAIFVGLSKGGLPAIGMLSVPVLSLVISPVSAAGLLLPVYVASDMFGLYAYRKGFDRRIMKILVPATTLGVALGWMTASAVPEEAVEALVGLIGAAFALTRLLRVRPQGAARKPRWAPGMFWGGLTGFTSFVSHAGSPPYQIYVLPLGLDKRAFAATTTVLFTYVNAIKLVPYWALGQLSAANLKIAGFLAVPAVLGVFAGVWLVRVLPEKLFFSLVHWALLIVSMRLIWSGIAHLF